MEKEVQSADAADAVELRGDAEENVETHGCEGVGASVAFEEPDEEDWRQVGEERDHLEVMGLVDVENRWRENYH